MGEYTNPYIATASINVAVWLIKSDKVTPEPPFLQAEQTQLLQPLLVGLVLQTPHQLCRPSLDSLEHLNVLIVVRGPKLNTVLEVQPHQSRVQGDDHLPRPAGHTVSDTSQDAVGQARAVSEI